MKKKNYSNFSSNMGIHGLKLQLEWNIDLSQYAKIIFMLQLEGYSEDQLNKLELKNVIFNVIIQLLNC